ncbi:MAG: DUF4349 domain-containing protein [Clostridiaceae bacterium]|nr:DUF4349 domain-containing protein [Clostridiaceae bacterium]
MMNQENRAGRGTGSSNRNASIAGAAFIPALAMLLAAVLFLVMIAGCSSPGMKTEDSVAADQYIQPTGAYSGTASIEVTFTDKAGSIYRDGIKSSYSESTASNEDIRKIIKSGDIAVEVKDVEAAYSRIIEIVNEVGGEEFNKAFTVSGDYKRMELVLKIPPENLDLFEQKLKEYVGEGKIKRSRIRSEDITSQYYDYAARLESYKASRDQLRELLKKAETVEDTLKIHSELTRIQAEIDSMQGQINMWDKLVEMATITLYIDEESNPMKMTRTVGWRFNSPGEIWMTMKNGFITVINGIYSVIVWIFIAIVSISPILIPVGIVIYAVLRRRKKNKTG